MIKILYVFTYGYSLESWDYSGFIQKELRYFQKLNDELNCEFTLLTYGDNSDLNIIDKEKYPYINVVPIYSITKIRQNSFLNYLFSLYVPFYIKKHTGDFDLIKQNQLLGSWVSILLKWVNRKPLFIRTGYDMLQFSIAEKKSILKRFLYKILTYFSLRFSDIYTVSSNSDLEYLKKKFSFANEKIHKISNWTENEIRKTYENRTSNKVLCVGRLEKQKNFEHIINQFSNSELEIDIVGTGTLMKELEYLANEKNTKVNFLGQKSYEELIDIYNNYKFYLSASFYEGNPKTILEAMGCGCLVIVSNLKNNKEIVSNKTGILFEFDDNLEQIFKNITKHELEYKKIAENGNFQILQTNSLNVIVKKEIDLINLLNS